MQKHTIAFDREGNALDLTDLNNVSTFKEREAFDQSVGAIIDNIKDFAKTHPKVDGKTKLFLYVHGALNSIKGANKRAEKNYQDILESDKYPLFINWEAAMFSAYGEHLFWIRQGRKTRFWGILTSPFFLFFDLVNAVARSFLIWGWQIKNRFAGETGRGVFQRNSKWIHSRLRSIFEAHQHQEGVIRVSPENNPVDVGFFKYVAFFLATLLLLPVRMLTAPLLASGGTNAWRIYKRRTFNLFRKSDEFDVRKMLSVHDSTLPMVRRTGDFSAFLDRLINELGALHARDNATDDEKLAAFQEHFSIDLAGHSTGAIIMNNLVTEFPKMPFSNLVYMGAACTIRNMYRTVVPHMLGNPDARLYILTLDPRSEMRENLHPFFPLIPNGSLLEWLDVYFTSPPHEMDRILGKWVNLMSVQHIFPASIRNRITLKKFDYHVEGQPNKHGEFDDVPEFHTREYWSV